MEREYSMKYTLKGFENFLEISDNIKVLMKNTKDVNINTIYDIKFNIRALQNMLETSTNDDISGQIKVIIKQLQFILSTYSDDDIDKMLKTSVKSNNKIDKIRNQRKYKDVDKPISNADYHECASIELKKDVLKFAVCFGLFGVLGYWGCTSLQHSESAYFRIYGIIGGTLSSLLIMFMLIKVVVSFIYVNIPIFRAGTFDAYVDTKYTSVETIEHKVDIHDRIDVAEGLLNELKISGFDCTELKQRLRESHGHSKIDTYVDIEMLYIDRQNSSTNFENNLKQIV